MLIDLLQQLGLSELEARLYLELHQEAGLSGYEVAKRVSVSRTNVYAALRSLLDKGACRKIEGDPVRYDAVPIEELLRFLRREFEQSAQTLLDELKTPPATAPAFYNWQGNEPIKLAIGRLIANADRFIVVDLWSEDLAWVERDLLAAEQRGVTAVLIVLGEVQSSLKNVIVHKRDEKWPSDAPRKFSVLCDMRTSITGSFGSGIKPTALETTHPAVIEILKVAFHEDLILKQIEADFGPELNARYGPNYEEIVKFYTEQKGWPIL